MNKLLALSVALLSVSLYGADKKEIRDVRASPLPSSLNGLEGLNYPFQRRENDVRLKQRGIGIVVQDYSDKDKTFDAKAIKNQIELRLLQSGIKVVDESKVVKFSTFGYIFINAQPARKGGR
ncbi:uncharacterized protein METZ01_LOCUS272712, partial [marine metagenome]